MCIISYSKAPSMENIYNILPCKEEYKYDGILKGLLLLLLFLQYVYLDAAKMSNWVVIMEWFYQCY